MRMGRECRRRRYQAMTPTPPDSSHAKIYSTESFIHSVNNSAIIKCLDLFLIWFVGFFLLARWNECAGG